MEAIISVGVLVLGVFALWYTKRARLAKSNNESLRNEPKAIFSVVLVPVGILLNFVGLGPFLYLMATGAIASFCLILGVLSILAIRRQPDTFKGSGLAGIGIAFSLFIFGVIGYSTFNS